jgi:hypothetical protein
MPEHQTDRAAALAALDVFVGAWVVEVAFPGSPSGRVAFAWALDRQYLLQRASAPDPVPDSLAIIAVGDEADPYLQHYFDSRGVTRLYRMGLAEGVWTLRRTDPDFSPLDFWQRFAGTFSGDNNRIDGRWEQSHDGGATWELDFHLTYTRVR